jgi:carboxyl-terminal processing protease
MKGLAVANSESGKKSCLQLATFHALTLPIRSIVTTHRWGRCQMEKDRPCLISIFSSVLGLLLAVTVVSAADDDANSAAEKDKKANYYEMMDVFVDTFEQIERNYVEDVDRRQLMEAAIEGMIAKLDPYSSYIGPKDLARFTRAVEQEFGGIGIQVDGPPRVPRLTVMSPLPGTPAYAAGIRAGDVIMEIEGKSTEGLSVADAVKTLTGKPGEGVNIGIQHAGSDKVEQVHVVRALIQVPTVQGDKYNPDSTWDFMLDPERKIGYVRLSHFSRHTADELRTALETLQKDGMRALVLDLRFNPGGLLSQATEIADMFIEDGRIVSTKGRNVREQVWDAKKPGTFSGFPMALLVNRYSASASEIVSACLQDHDRAVVVGERTWGKGSVQNVIELEDKKSALKLTTASYHRPSGKNIHRFPNAKETDEWGVMPNPGYEVKLSREEMGEYQDYREHRDILSDKGPPASNYVDPQLAKALDYIFDKLGEPAKAEKPKAAAEKTDKAAAAPGQKDGDKRAAEAPFHLPSFS